MRPKKSNNKGPLDRFFKKVQVSENNQPSNLQPAAKPCGKLVTSQGCALPLTKCQLGSSPAPCRTLDKQEQEPHATHSFEWCCSDKKPKNLTCDQAGTVEDSLKRSPQFRDIAEKNKNKELVILRDGKAISSHFPCRLIKKKLLTVKYIKALDKLKQSVENRGPKRRAPSNKLVMFHVLTSGGKNVMKIMRNPALKKLINEITVYAYKGEKVKHALRRDGRLLNDVFKKNCALSHTSTEVTTEMSNLVDDLDGSTFKIILLNKSSPPESQGGSLDDAYMMQNESQISDGNQDPPQQSTTTESTSDNTPKEKPELNVHVEPEIILSVIPNSKGTRHQLLSEFQERVKGMKTQPGSKPSHIQNLFRVEYGKNAQTCREVKTMKKLMDLSNSVCHVRINGRPGGSGFLLFDKFVLTNGHVLKKIYNVSTRQLSERVTVHFSYESLDQMDPGAEVEEVTGFEYGSDQSGHQYDWALLRLRADVKLPDGLLTHFGFLPQSGAICIIGHPEGGVKRIDPCLITPSDNRNQVVERHYRENPGGVLLHHTESGVIPILTSNFFEGFAEFLNRNMQILTYGTCFDFGSSGSPVFDEHCNVVAMHTGGCVYENRKREPQSVIEYGHPLSIIIEHIIVQIVEREKFGVLKEYLACSYARHQNLMTSLKKLVESRNLTAFTNAINNSVVSSDESLKAFFEFFCQKEDPVPMDTD